VPPDRATDFDLERIIADTFVEQVQYHETIDSTSTAALESSQHLNSQTPLLVLASQQTAGRGRGSNTWWSATGSLTFSLLLDPANLGIVQRDWPRASLTTGLAICLALDELLDDQLFSLKWPNDVLLNDRKISGILVEAGAAAAGQLVIGIGINVNNSFQDAPDPLPMTATSLIDTAEREFALEAVLVSVLQQLERQLERLSSHDPALAADWQQRSALNGRTVEVITEKHSRQGICQGIDEHGALILETTEGPVQIFAGLVREVE